MTSAWLYAFSSVSKFNMLKIVLKLKKIIELRVVNLEGRNE